MRSILCPAKINLSLHLLGPRNGEGFTPLHSVVMKVDWCDTLTLAIDLEKPAGFSLHCNWPELTQSPQDNLVVKALLSYWQALGQPLPGACEITLTKRIPHQAGLGGGSSNAAGMLVLLKEWCVEQGQPGLSDSQLLTVAQTLGSDIPLFLNPNSLVTMTGRGEHITVADPDLMPTEPCLIVKPLSVNVPTGWAYEQVHSKAAYSQPSTRLYHNDFESALFPTQPALVDSTELLRQLGATQTLLCGSGSALAAWFEHHEVPTNTHLAEVFPASGFVWQWVKPLALPVSHSVSIQ
jgi:4-diphosphocytidyl-2-C-methyl-D-erythritol kinase